MSAVEEPKRISRATPTYVERDLQGKCVGLTADGIALVENLATYGKPQRYIASKLGITGYVLDKLLGKASDDPATEVRMAWERGHGAFEAQYRKLLMKHVAKNPIACIFAGKAIFGMKDNPALIDVKNEDRRIQITLPGPMSQEEFFKGLGIDAPLDFRRDRSKSHPLLPKGVSGTQPPRGLPAPGGDVVEGEFTEVPKGASSAYPPGRYSRTKCSYMKSIGAWSDAIHTVDE